MARHAIITAFMPQDDNQGAMRTLMQGVNGHIEVFPEEVDRYRLKGVVPDVEVHVWQGFGTQTPSDQLPNNQKVKMDALLEFQTGAARQTLFVPPPSPITREWVITRLKQMAKEHGCSHAWVLATGDSTTATTPSALLAKFLPL